MNFDFSKYYELVGHFLIDAAKIIFASVIVIPVVEKTGNWAMLLVGCSSTLLALSLGIFLSKKNK